MTEHTGTSISSTRVPDKKGSDTLLVVDIQNYKIKLYDNKWVIRTLIGTFNGIEVIFWQAMIHVRVQLFSTSFCSAVLYMKYMRTHLIKEVMSTRWNSKAAGYQTHRITMLLVALTRI